MEEFEFDAEIDSQNRTIELKHDGLVEGVLTIANGNSFRFDISDAVRTGDTVRWFIGDSMGSYTGATPGVLTQADITGVERLAKGSHSLTVTITRGGIVYSSTPISVVVQN